MPPFRHSVICHSAALLLLTTAIHAATPAFIPMPTKYQPREGTFPFTRPTILASKDLLPLAQNFAAPFHLRIINRDANSSINGPTLTLALHPDPAGNINPESYTLDITPTDITISAPTPAGAFYALQTLRQLFPTDLESPLPYIAPTTEPAPTPAPDDEAPPSTPQKPILRFPSIRPLFALKNPTAQTTFPLPCLHIEDAPRYPWRGILLDCSRHFFPKQYILRTIDALALHKLNTLHWHLTDDQGWRIEILQYPKLTQISAFRSRAEPLPARPRGGAAAAQPATQQTDEHYGGFYSQDDIHEIVDYAQSRFITVVPEIEMPGHSTAVLAAYPEFACTDVPTGGPIQVATRWGVFNDIYCPSPETFTFLHNTLDEVCDLFPSPYIHIGGDEVPKDRWKASAFCQQLLADLHLKDENALQSHFVHQIGNYLANEKNKRFIGWDEIMEGGLAPGAIVQSWRGTAGGKAAALADGGGHDVIMSPQSHCYFDHPYQPDDKNENTRATAAVPLDKVYNFNPLPEGLTPKQAKHILGAEGNVWSERIPTPQRADYMTFPRACALAEALWTAPDFHDNSRDYANFSTRLTEHFKRLHALNISFFDDPIAHATLLATWKPNDFEKQSTTRDYDITPQLQHAQPGPLKIRLDLTNGQNKLTITSITLTEKETQIAADSHPASAATSSKATLYTLTVPSLDPTAKHTLHITAAADTGPDTTGNILLLPPQ